MTKKDKVRFILNDIISEKPLKYLLEINVHHSFRAPTFSIEEEFLGYEFIYQSNNELT